MQMELYLARDIKGNKNNFFRYINDIKKAWEDVKPPQKENGDLITRNRVKAEVPNDCFVSVFTGCTTQPPENKGREWEKEEPPIKNEDQIQELLKNLKVHKAMGSNETHPWVLRDLEDKVAKPLSTIFGNLWHSRKVSAD